MNVFRKVTICFLLLTTLITTISVSSASSEFKDVSLDFWGHDTIQWALKKGVVAGFADGTFRPNEQVTEEQFLAILFRSMGDIADLSKAETSHDNLEIIQRWSDKYYNFAKSMNYPITGERNKPISRKSVAEIIVGTQGFNYIGENAIIYLLGKGISKGKVSPTVEGYKSADFLTRAEAVQFVRGFLAAADSKIPLLRPTVLSETSELSPLLSPGKTSIVDQAKTEYFTVSIFVDGKGSDATTIAEMDAMRSQLASIDPDLHVTWAMTNDFVFDESNRPQLAHILNMVDHNGDEVGIGFGFPNNLSTLDSWVSDMNEFIYMYRYNALNTLHINGSNGDPSVWKSIPDKYKPKSVTTYAINEEQAAWVKQHFGIDSFMGWTATQYNVDQLSAEGSPLMPYYSHRNNPMIPAQDKATNSGNVFMNTITVDPIGSTYANGESRWTIHPADPLTNGVEQLYTIGQYLHNPYRNRNTINYLSLFIDINWIARDKNLNKSWNNMISNWDKQTNVQIVGVNEFSKIWKNTAGADNAKSEFTLLFRGSGLAAGDGHLSDSMVQYLWTETRSERIILKKRDGDSAWSIIDFTDYTVAIPIMQYTIKGHDNDLSFVTGRNFKIAVAAHLKDNEKIRIQQRLNELKFTDEVAME